MEMIRVFLQVTGGYIKTSQSSLLYLKLRDFSPSFSDERYEATKVVVCSCLAGPAILGKVLFLCFFLVVFAITCLLSLKLLKLTLYQQKSPFPSEWSS